MAEAIPTPARYSRMNAEPYLEGEKFDSMQAAEEYLLSPVCYPSQIISVKKDGEKYYPYIINEKDGAKVLDPIMGDSGGSGGGETDVRNAVVIPNSSLPATATMVPVPVLVPVLQALASGETIPPVFVSVQPIGGSGLSLISPAHFELFNHTGNPSIPQFYYRLEYSIMNGNNPNTLQGEMRRRVMTGTGAFDGESVTLDRRTFYEEQLPYLTGSASKVLTQRGTFVDMPTAPGNATASSDGLMSKEDKAKLDGIAEGANKTEFINFDSRWFDSGTIPADVVAKIKEHELPLLVYDSQYDLRHAGSYLWNGTVICVSCFDSQGDSTRIVSAKYNPDGTRISVNRVAIGKSGDGSKFLSDDGTYKEPSVEVDSVLDEASSNPVQNKAVAKAINDIIQDLADLPGIIKTITTCDVVTESNPNRYKITISSIRPIGLALNAGVFVYLVGIKRLGRISSISGGYAYIRYDEAFSSMS